MIYVLLHLICAITFNIVNTAALVSRTTVLQSMKLGVDVNRHKEIIVKAISAVLLLLLKHFKLNHVYQVSMYWCELVSLEMG